MFDGQNDNDNNEVSPGAAPVHPVARLAFSAMVESSDDGEETIGAASPTPPLGSSASAAPTAPQRKELPLAAPPTPPVMPSLPSVPAAAPLQVPQRPPCTGANSLVCAVCKESDGARCLLTYSDYYSFYL